MQRKRPLFTEILGKDLLLWCNSSTFRIWRLAKRSFRWSSLVGFKALFKTLEKFAMKKTLIALAAFAATASFAQSTVTMYGNVDVGYGAHKTTSRDGTAFTKSSGVMDGSWAGSRLGFRGTEDLGGGLKANFLVEQGINPTGANGFNQRVGTFAHQLADAAGTAYTANNNRQSYLGLSGGFGEVRVGFQYTNSYDLAAFQGYSLSEFQGGNYQNQTHANGTRANAITYIAPTMSGVTLKAQFGQGAGRMTAESNAVASIGAATGTLTQNNNQYTSLMANYTAGPLNVSYAYSKADLETSAGAAAQTGPVSNNIGASYNLGFATISATMGNLKDGAAAQSTTKAQQFSVKVPFGATDLLVSTGSAKKTTVGAAAVATDSSGTTIGVSHALSKRTNVYAFTGKEKNDAITAVNGAGYKDSKTMVGVRHTF
jgi:predicted porin